VSVEVTMVPTGHRSGRLRTRSRRGVGVLRPGRLLGRTLGFVGRVALKIGVARRAVLVVVGIVVVAVLILLTMALLGG
jgi:hypothetical protein